MAECDGKKKTLCGGWEEGRQGGVKQHDQRATRVLFRTGLCVHVISVSFCAYFRVLNMFDLVVRCLSIKRLKVVALTALLLICLFVYIVHSLRVVCYM